jgi:hypothetical protein
MSECANCNHSVYVPDGYEFNEGDLCTSCLNDKVDRLQALVESADERNGAMMWTSDHDKIIARFKDENDKLRGLLAAGKGDCVYCGLPAADIAKCPSGFPGCGRMDDIVNAPEGKFEREVAALTMKLAAYEKEVTDGPKRQDC